jgi:hypothetical protein
VALKIGSKNTQMLPYALRYYTYFHHAWHLPEAFSLVC